MKRVVIIDADTNFTSSLSTELARYHFDMYTFTEPGNIFDLVYRYEPDIILINYILNDSNGGTISHQIKSDPETHHIPVIMMSDYTDLCTLWRKFGCNDYLLKPINPKQLIEKINFWLEDAHAHAFSH